MLLVDGRADSVTRNALPAGNEITWCPAAKLVVGEAQAPNSHGLEIDEVSERAGYLGGHRGAVYLDDGTGAASQYNLCGQ